MNDGLNTPCIEWDHARQSGGYGVRWVNGKLAYAHRVAWEEAHGPIPTGMHVCHHCDNPPCYNVDHLFLGTRLDNMRDMWAKGRGNPGRLPGEAHPNSKLTDRDVLEIRSRWAAGGWTQPALAQRFGVSKSLIYRIIHHHAWAHIPAVEPAR